MEHKDMTSLRMAIAEAENKALDNQNAYDVVLNFIDEQIENAIGRNNRVRYRDIKLMIETMKEEEETSSALIKYRMDCFKAHREAMKEKRKQIEKKTKHLTKHKKHIEKRPKCAQSAPLLPKFLCYNIYDEILR